jgi:F-box and WD-40 domain protein CDC4
MTPNREIAGPANPNPTNLTSDASTNALPVDIGFDDIESDTGVIDSDADADLIDLHSDIKVTGRVRFDAEVRYEPPNLSSNDTDSIEHHSDDGTDVVATDESSTEGSTDDSVDSTSIDPIETESDNDSHGHVRNEGVVGMTGDQYTTESRSASKESSEPDSDNGAMGFNRRDLIHWFAADLGPSFKPRPRLPVRSVPFTPVDIVEYIQSIPEPEPTSVASMPPDTVEDTQATPDPEAKGVASIPQDTTEDNKSNSGAEAGSVACSPDAVNVTKSSSRSDTTKSGSVPSNTV